MVSSRFRLVIFACESKEHGGRGISRFPCVTLVGDTPVVDRVTFRILSNMNDGAPV